LVVTSDHGLSKTDHHFCLVEFLKKRGCRPFYYPLIHRRGCDVAVMQSGNAMAHLYFRGGREWGDPLTFAELIEKGRLSLLQELSASRGIGWIALRSAEGGVVILNGEGKGLLNTTGGKYRYQVLGTDPLGLIENEVYWSGHESLHKTFDSAHPDAFVQLHQLFRSNRSGDVIVCAKEGWDLRDKFESPEHFASHGSLVASHMNVPIFISQKFDMHCPPRTVDLYPTILDLLGLQSKKRIDGVSLVRSTS